MGLISQSIDVFLHLDKYLGLLINNYGVVAYLFLFLIILCETGLVVMPFLPGDSLIFAAGAFAALGYLNIAILFSLLIVAAITGDTINYHVGKLLGSKLIGKEDSKIIKKKHIDKTNTYFEKYGGKTIIIARFIPIVRTFAPFVAGIGTMKYGSFIMFNAIGGIMWVTLVLSLGFFFGNLPIVANNFSLVTVAIIFISITPLLWEVVRSKGNKDTVVENNNI